ncbi:MULTISPECIES: hypothetical protein [Streptomyces]|uniref:hypothetical protein n=1 Tax=Streptomyces TaxID=1883 RepID=UPI0006AD90A1|nr:MULTISPECIES: hypothetical protein [unclassified Streptomyces]GLV95831.1 hypothetical protein Slala04_72840 [Streptomyces lavendulae subsp. lavendulae]KOU77762.1 hypothetical protein ADK94_35570 [Streptomyces sp. XY593]KOU89649.1 hypothetical protein ADK92_37005 [Streptomyces sp. XY533]KOV17056.1 hypothetical protein ADK91_03135 [Streptomyces sp. XY511]MCI4078925.1 hypothetical protein [Streptomyces sp. MMS21 TC-5]
MNDHLEERTEADDVLDALLRAHAVELHNAVGRAIDSEAGLANLQPFKQAPAVHPQADAEIALDVAAGLLQPAVSRGMAAQRLSRALRLESLQARVLHSKLCALGDTALRVMKPDHFHELTGYLVNYEDDLAALGLAFVAETQVDRGEALALLTTYTDFVALMKGYFAMERQHSGRALRSAWREITDNVDRRAKALAALHGDVQWIFDASDDLQEVTS